MGKDEEDPNRPTFWQVLVSVLAALLGVQNNEARERDFQHGKFINYVVVGLIVMVLFILTLVMIVKFALSQLN